MNTLSEKIIELIQSARNYVVKTTNTTMVFTYFQIGRLIVEELQQGEPRAGYGEKLLIQVSKDLTKKLGRGFSVQNIERMRNFYLIYANSSNELRNSDVFNSNFPKTVRGNWIME